MTRSRVRRRYRQSSNRGKRYEDFFCLAPTGIRVGYASPKLLRGLPRRERAGLRDRVVWVSTANRRYSAAGVRPGSKLGMARRRLHLGRGIQVGLNRWFFGRAGGATVLAKVRHGVVEEIGIVMPALARTPAEQRRFSRSFS